MRQHLRRWINDAALVRLGGAYEGVIASVTEEPVRNRYTARRQIEPVISFEDGWRVIPNITMRAALIELFGPHTEGWVGRRISILRRRVESVNRQSGEIKERWQKSVYCEDRHARVIRHPAAKRADYDDSDEVPREAGASAELTAEDIFGDKRATERGK